MNPAESLDHSLDSACIDQELRWRSPAQFQWLGTCARCEVKPAAHLPSLEDGQALRQPNAVQESDEFGLPTARRFRSDQDQPTDFQCC